MDRRSFLSRGIGGILALLGLSKGMNMAFCQPHLAKKGIVTVTNGDSEGCCPRCKHVGNHAVIVEWLRSFADGNAPNLCVFNWREYRQCSQCSHIYGDLEVFVDFSRNTSELVANGDFTTDTDWSKSVYLF